MLPLDPLGVGTAEGDVSPEDVFNPILYKPMSNFGMSQLEARINYISTQHAGEPEADVAGNTAVVDVDTVTSEADEFPIYYGLLSETRNWRHANPQAGLEMRDLKPLVYEQLVNINQSNSPALDGLSAVGIPNQVFKGASKPLPWLNCTEYVSPVEGYGSEPGFNVVPKNAESHVPEVHVVVGAIIIPPSRLHEMFYRMVVEWTIEFSSIRPLGEITDWIGLGNIAVYTHYKNYDYSNTKELLTGSSDTILEKDVSMASGNVDINKVM